MIFPLASLFMRRGGKRDLNNSRKTVSMSKQEPRKVQLTGRSLSSVSMKVAVRVRTSLAGQHMLAAALFSRRVKAIESENQGKSFGPFYEEILSFSSACVLMAVAALEAYANEVYADRGRHFPNIDAMIVDKCWELIEQKPILEKLGFALSLLKAPQLEKGQYPYQDADTLIQLRNALMHFKPAWDTESEAHANLSRRLKNVKYKFAPSPFFSAHEPVFPRTWATHGCTKWAVETALAIIDKFESRAKFTPKFAPFKDRLAT